MWASSCLPFAFRAPKPLFCHTGGKDDLPTYKCERSATATAAAQVPDIKIRIASNLGCGAPCRERDADAYERALLKYGDPRWTSVPSSPERGTAAYAQEAKTVDREQCYTMYLRRSFIWHSKATQSGGRGRAPSVS